MNRDMTKGARFFFYFLLFLMGGAFWIAAKTGHFHMSEAVYGAAVKYPAVWWALAMLAPSSAYLAALFINGRRWWTAPTRIMIAAWMMTYFASFVVAALPSAGVDIVVIASGALAVAVALLAAFDIADAAKKKGPRHE